MSQHADVDEDVAALVEAVETDPRLTPAERETSIRFPADTDTARVFTAEPAIARRLLAHPERGHTHVNVAEGDARPTRAPAEHNGEAITGVTTELPIGVLKISQKPRTSTGHAGTVTRIPLKEVRK